MDPITYFPKKKTEIFLVDLDSRVKKDCRPKLAHRQNSGRTCVWSLSTGGHGKASAAAVVASCCNSTKV